MMTCASFNYSRTIPHPLQTSSQILVSLKSHTELTVLSKMSAQTTPPNPVTDPYKFLKITLNPDGTITRKLIFPLSTPNTNDLTSPVLSKDIPINSATDTWARIYVPSSHLHKNHKLPLIIYIHGGGFILLSAASSIYHDFCNAFALYLPAIVVSIDYRLASEHRLPAAYNDCMEALYCIKNHEDEWIRDYADCSSCFLMGNSAGGNIAYHVALRACFQVDHLKPLQIRGLILDQPFFGGVKRGESERTNDPVLPTIVSDLMWELSLPIGADRNHEYCNPTVDVGSKGLEKIRELGWKVLVSGCYGDTLIDRQVEIVKLLKERGIEVKGEFVEGGCHGKHVFDVSKALLGLFVHVKDFIY